MIRGDSGAILGRFDAHTVAHTVFSLDNRSENTALML